MKKLILGFAACCLAIFSLSATAAPSSSGVETLNKLFSADAQPYDANCPFVSYSTANFCQAFSSSAQCACMAACTKDLSKTVCADTVCNGMHMIYDVMTTKDGGIQKACQSSVNPENCIQDWTCYLTGSAKVNGQIKKCNIASPDPTYHGCASWA